MNKPPEAVEPRIKFQVDMKAAMPAYDAGFVVDEMIPPGEYADENARAKVLLGRIGNKPVRLSFFSAKDQPAGAMTCKIETFEDKPGRRPGEFEMGFTATARLKPFEEASKSKDIAITNWLNSDKGQKIRERLQTLEDAKINYKAVLVRDQSTREVKDCLITVTPGELKATKEERIQGIVSKGLDEGAKLVGATLEDVFYGHPGEVDLNKLPDEIKREFSRILQGKNEVSAQMLENWANVLEVLPPKERQAWLKKFPSKAFQARISGYAALFGDFGWKILKDVLGEKVETNKWGKRAVDNVPTLSSLMTIALREAGDKKVRKIVREQKQSEEPETVYVASAEPQAA